MASSRVTHYALIEPATESDNVEWAYVLCDPNERMEDPAYCSAWQFVSCKRCLKNKPKTTEAGA